MNDLTVCYYSCNREDPAFEARIQHTLLDTIGDMPVISVTHKPIDFGHNICVGDVGVSAHNAWRQLQIGALHAKTRFVCPGEADLLFPPEFFHFRPPRDDTFYLAMPLWVLNAQRGKAHQYSLKPRGSEAAMIVNRDLLIQRLGQILDPTSQWSAQDADGDKLPFPLDRRVVKREYFTLSQPIVTIKTDENIHRKTPHDVESRTRSIPYWGDSGKLLSAYVG